MEAVKRLLKIDPNAKVIVSSGYLDDMITAEYRECGFKDVLSKPYRIEKMRDILHNVINEE